MITGRLSLKTFQLIDFRMSCIREMMFFVVFFERLPASLGNGFGKVFFSYETRLLQANYLARRTPKSANSVHWILIFSFNDYQSERRLKFLQNPVWGSLLEVLYSVASARLRSF